MLIPRPETEELIEKVLQRIKQYQQHQQQQDNPKEHRLLRILDIGCGSGIIGISILKEASHFIDQVVAIDLQLPAIELTQENAKRLLLTQELNKFHTEHISIEEIDMKHLSSFDLIVSNPPYIPSSQLPDLQPEIRSFEDPIALDGGLDGLKIIRSIIEKASCLLKSKGLKEVWLEVDSEHPLKLQQLYQNKHPLFQHCRDIEIFKDLSGNWRFVKLKFS
jgi:release factor glutamine methyltransferase